MLAIVYLALVFWVGDAICRRFYRFVSVPHRLAAAFLVGMLISSWFTYLAARIFASTTRPLLWGDILFFAATIGAFVWVRRKEKAIAATSTGALAGELVVPSATLQTEEGSAAEKIAAPTDERPTPQTEEISTSPVNADEISALPEEGTSAPAANPEEPLATADETSALPAGGLYLPRRAGSDRL